jgi:hypothetical protein
MTKHALAIALLGAFAAPVQAGIADDLGECLDNAVKHAYVTAKAAAAIADMLADPVLGLCVSQVLLPDPLTIAGSGAVVAVAAATSISPGHCDAGLRDKAFDPLINALSGVIGLSPQQDPLKSVLAEGKAQAWDYLKTTPPPALVWSKLSCGCTFYDKGAAIDDIKKVVQATTAAGKSCGKVLGPAAEALGGAAGWVGNKIACAMEGKSSPLDTALNLMNPYDYYLTYWRPFEQGYVYRNLTGKTDMSTPIPGGLQFGSEAAEAVFKTYGNLQVDYQNAGTPQSLDQLRAGTLGYYECTNDPSKIAKQIGDWFYQSADAKLAVAKVWLSFKQTAGAARSKKEETYLDPYKASGNVSSMTLDAIGSALTEWTDNAWKAYQGNLSSKPADVLALTFNEIKPKMDGLKQKADDELKAVKNKNLIAPVRRLAADGNLEKLGQLGGEKLCEGMHALLAAECRRDTDDVRKAAADVLKLRDNKKNWTMTEAANYGKAEGTKQLTPNTRYTYAPTIPDPRNDDDWANNAKYDAVLKADQTLREKFSASLEARAAAYPAMQDRLDKLVSVYQNGCGEAIGQPGSAPTPMCREYLANGVAACLVDTLRQSAKTGVTSVSAKPGAAASAQFAPIGAALLPAPKPAQQTQTPAGGTGPVQATPGAQAGAAFAPDISKAGAVPASLAVSECDASAKSALERYAKAHKKAPGQDRPVTNYFANLKPASSSAPGPLPRDAVPPGSLRLRPGVGSEDAGDRERQRSLRSLPAGERDEPTRSPPESGRALRLPPPGGAGESSRGIAPPALPTPRTFPPADGIRMEVPPGRGLRPLPPPAAGAPASGVEPGRGIAPPALPAARTFPPADGIRMEVPPGGGLRPLPPPAMPHPPAAGAPASGVEPGRGIAPPALPAARTSPAGVTQAEGADRRSTEEPAASARILPRPQPQTAPSDRAIPLVPTGR